jgi:hypothetical protein
MANNLKGKKITAQPYDENFKPLSGLVLPMVDGSGNVIGWAPVGVVDNGDGTVSLKVDTELSIDTATLNIKNVKVAGTDQTGDNLRYLKCDNDGTLFVTVASAIPSDVNITKVGGTPQSPSDWTSLFSHLDTNLSTRASEVTLSAVKTDLASSLTKLDSLIAKDYATETTLYSLKTTIKVGSTNQTAGGVKYLKVDNFGNVVIKTLDEQAVDDGVGFVVINSNTSSASPEDVLYLINGFTKTLRITEIAIHNFDTAGASAWDLFLNPTVSNNGTSLIIRNRNTNNTTVSTAAAFRNPTVTNTGVLIWTTTTDGNLKAKILDPHISLSPGDRLLLRRTGSGGGNNQRIMFQWIEV